MEAAIINIEQERSITLPKLPQLECQKLSNAVDALVEVLEDVFDQQTTEDENTSSREIGIEWLHNLVKTISSEFGNAYLVRAVWSAARLPDEVQQQGALFDILGEDGMEIMFQIAEHLPQIANIAESELPPECDSNISIDANQTSYVDMEEERRRHLLQEAQNAAQVAAIAKAEAELASNSNMGGTHTLSRKSDLRAQKAAKKAAKHAEQALKAAKDAGAIVDEQEWIAFSQENTIGSGGLMNRSTAELQEIQNSLLPEGSRQLYNKKDLPSGTEREYGEGYEKVTIPATKRDERKLHQRLPIADIMSSECARVFEGTKSLNPMQSAVFEAAFHRRDNLLICAPTGAGKTNVALLSVTSHFRDVGLLASDEDRVVETGKKVVYIAPMKALAQEVVEKFNSKLKPLRLIVRELTGDMQLTKAEAESANILVTTPEKWDVVTRKSGNDENSLGNQCGLLIIDEVHLLADERGAVIESVVARLHRSVESRQRQVRIVGLSATLPNYRDVAEFLQVPSKGLFFFGPEHRPVPLQQQFIGTTTNTKDRWLKEKHMNEICYDVVLDSLRRGYQVMVFVHSRKGTGETASALAELAQENGELEKHFVTKGKEGSNGDAHSRYSERVAKSRNREVSLHFPNGLGIHHAGMLRGDRKLSEQMFNDGAIKVLCCTATLAWGVNLPAHTVIIKGTEVYNPEKGSMMDLSILDVQQIFGRAGRPQFDSSGEATLITTQDAMQRYLDKLVRPIPIESNFIKQLADHLNAEVVGGTVTNIEEAITWLSYTYLHVRMTRNPLAYGISLDQHSDDPALRNHCRELINTAALFLDKNRMLRYHIESGNLGVVDMGRVAAHFYIQAESVSTFNEKLENDPSPSDQKLAHVICCAAEFENVRIRQEELSEIGDIIEKACPLEVIQPVHEPSDKCLVLMQAFISRHNIRSFTLISDTNYIASNAGRVARAMFEMCLKRSSAGCAVKLLRIAKSIDRRIWWFQTPLRHFESELKSNVYAALESKQIGGQGYDTFEYTISLLDMQPSEVGQLCHWSKGGKKVQSLIEMLPYVEIDYSIQPVTSSVLRFHISLQPTWNWQSRWHGGAEGFWLLIEDSGNNRIYHHESILFTRRTHPEPISIDVTIPAFNPLPKQYFIRLISDSWVGIEQLIPVSFDDIKMPQQTTMHTDLIDLTPLPTSALQETKYEQLYQKYTTFNPIQSQLFHVLYHTDVPIFVGAPTGSGKTTIAELSLLRMKRLHPKGICVYIAPLKSLARERLREWKKKLGVQPLNWNVLELSGDTHHDQNVLSKADVLVCTPEKWDLLSRGWKGSDTFETNARHGKAFIKRVRLLVIDEIHLLGEDRGAVLEAIVSRTRFISQYMATENGGPEWTRIVGLSTALANPHDLADWLGIDTKGHLMSSNRGLYNFRPSVRPIPMDVHIQGFAGKHYCPRMATMNKPCYSAIKEHSPLKPTLIFVASRRQTRLTALDIISYAAADDNAKTFLGCSEDFIEAVTENIDDKSLHHTLSFGIGIHHAGLSSNDRDTVEKLYLEGKIRVLVATATLAWGVNLPAHFVIVKGTEYFDGKASRYVDYPLTDVLQMIGRAGRPGFDTEGVAVVMVEESKKNFYKKFLYQPFPIESCLGARMCENLNAEISIGTIQSVMDAVGYLSWTFFSRRLRANPSYYGAKSDSEDDIDNFLLQTVQEALQKLEEHNCVVLDMEEEIDRNVQSTILGRCASNYYLSHLTPKQMDFGIKEAIRLINAAITSEENRDSKMAENYACLPFQTSLRVNEISVSWILYTLCNTHEFDELPVRHNEEHLNADLSHDVIWGADVTTVLNPGQERSEFINLDVMADPHTKCFLLVQAYLEHTKLPISDYFNDMKTVMDQIPRLLAAMQYISVQDYTVAGNLDLICGFSKVKQVISSRKPVNLNPLRQVREFSKEITSIIEDQCRVEGSDQTTLFSLRSKSKNEGKTMLKTLLKGRKIQVDKMMDSVFALPFYTVKEVNTSLKISKATGRRVGSLKLKIDIDAGKPKDCKQMPTLVLVLGSLKRKALLAHWQGRMYSGIKEVEMEFDWDNANEGGGEGDGGMILRLLVEEYLGLDCEMHIPLLGEKKISNSLIFP